MAQIVEILDLDTSETELEYSDIYHKLKSTMPFSESIDHIYDTCVRCTRSLMSIYNHLGIGYRVYYSN